MLLGTSKLECKSVLRQISLVKYLRVNPYGTLHCKHLTFKYKTWLKSLPRDNPSSLRGLIYMESIDTGANVTQLFYHR